MSRTIKRCFDKNLTFLKMLEAHERAKRGKMGRLEVFNFELNLECNLINIIEKIRLGQYQIGQYRSFTVYEPKERVIKALPYVDRVVHQWYVHEFIKPYFIPRLITNTFACLDNRGTHKAVDALQRYMRIMKRNYGTNYYILKMDVKKFFYTIDQKILFNIMRKYIKDKKLLAFTKLLISNDEKIGIPIGNYTSQFFANIYLNELDQYVKHILKIKYYVRYMDDFVILVDNKEKAKVIKEKINNFLNFNLKLSLNAKSRYYPNRMGVDFCGYRIWSTHRLVRNRCKKKIRKQIKRWNKLYISHKLDKKKFILAFNSWLGHIKHADSFNLKKQMIRQISFITMI